MAEATVKVEHLPEFAALYSAVHRLLVTRLCGDLGSIKGLQAWNSLIEAHDAIAMLHIDGTEGTDG